MSENERGPGGIKSPGTSHGSRDTGHGPLPARVTSDEIRATAPCGRCCANCRYALPVEHEDETLLLCPCQGNRCGRFSAVEPGNGCREFQAKVLAEQKEDETTRLIPLVNVDGWYAMVDPPDYEWLRQYTWRATCSGGGTFYACTYCKGKLCYMHRMIVNPPEGMVVDHKNRCGLDNHRINLRSATHRQNCANHRPAPGASGFIGVVPIGDKWGAQIPDCGKTLYLGLYDDPVEAARVRDRKAIELHGEFACLNFPQEAQDRIVSMGGTIRARSGARARLQCVTCNCLQAGRTPARPVPFPGRIARPRAGSAWSHWYRLSPIRTFAPDGQNRRLHRISLGALKSLSAVSWRTAVAEVRPSTICSRSPAFHGVRPLPLCGSGQLQPSGCIPPARPPPGRVCEVILSVAWASCPSAAQSAPTQAGIAVRPCL